MSVVKLPHVFDTRRGGLSRGHRFWRYTRNAHAREKKNPVKTTITIDTFEKPSSFPRVQCLSAKRLGGNRFVKLHLFDKFSLLARWRRRAFRPRKHDLIRLVGRLLFVRPFDVVTPRSENSYCVRFMRMCVRANDHARASLRRLTCSTPTAKGQTIEKNGV